MESTQLKSYAFESKFAGAAIEQGAQVELSAGAPGAWQLIRGESNRRVLLSGLLRFCFTSRIPRTLLVPEVLRFQQFPFSGDILVAKAGNPASRRANVGLR